MAAAGTLTLTQNSTAVTGSGTAFTTALAVGGFIVVTVGGTAYTLGIKSIESNTALTLQVAYNGPTTSGVAFDYVPMATLNLITSALAAQVTYALRAANLDRNNWQQIFNGTGNVTVTLPDGSQYTGPAWGGLIKRDGSVAMTSALTTPALELMGSTPYIDFHFNNSSSDYTARIIHTESQAVEISAGTGNISFRINGGLRVGGASYSGGINLYRGNGDANALWGINCSDANLNFIRGSSAGGNVDFGDSVLKNVRGMTGKQGRDGSYGVNTYSFFWNTSSQLEAWVDTSKVGNVTLSSTSDKELKKDITYREDASKALAEVLEWRPADFKMKARGIIPETAEQLGFIANDLVKVSPECVSGKGLPDDYDIEADPNNDSAYYLNHIPMIAKLAQAIQAQQKELAEQREIIKAMGARLKDLDGLDG